MGSCLLEQGFSGLRHSNILIRTMPATVAAAGSFFEMISGRKNHISLVVVIKIFAFDERCCHGY
jgi:hypothetical protein